MAVTTQESPTATAVRPFPKIEFPEAELKDLRARIQATRWPETVEKAYPKLIRFNRLERGGHFAAWGQPELFVEEVRTGFRSLR